MRVDPEIVDIDRQLVGGEHVDWNRPFQGEPVQPGWCWFRPTPDAEPHPVKEFNANAIVYCAEEFAGPFTDREGAFSVAEDVSRRI